VRFRDLLTAAAIQLVVLFLPLAAGVVGLISGGMAGLSAVLTWFVLGIPLSYAAIDRLARARAHERPRVASAPATLPSATIS
jgi:hypothetical protein